MSFFSYLTKICDQVICLISQDHASKLVWKNSAHSVSLDEDENSDRVFRFEVSKTNEQEESVSWRAGFQVCGPVSSHNLLC
jgi:hypothetical protein